MTSSLRNTVDAQLVGYIVGKLITCPSTGEVLDARTCVVFRDRDGDPVTVVSQNGYKRLTEDQIDRLAAAGYQVDTETIRSANSQEA